MLFEASHMAALLNAAGTGFNRPSDWRFMGTRACAGFSKAIDRTGQRSIRKAE